MDKIRQSAIHMKSLKPVCHRPNAFRILNERAKQIVGDEVRKKTNERIRDFPFKGFQM